MWHTQVTSYFLVFFITNKTGLSNIFAVLCVKRLNISSLEVSEFTRTEVLLDNNSFVFNNFWLFEREFSEKWGINAGCEIIGIFLSWMAPQSLQKSSSNAWCWCWWFVLHQAPYLGRSTIVGMIIMLKIKIKNYYINSYKNLLNF